MNFFPTKTITNGKLFRWLSNTRWGTLYVTFWNFSKNEFCGKLAKTDFEQFFGNFRCFWVYSCLNEYKTMLYAFHKFIELIFRKFEFREYEYGIGHIKHMGTSTRMSISNGIVMFNRIGININMRIRVWAWVYGYEYDYEYMSMSIWVWAWVHDYEYGHMSMSTRMCTGVY